MVRGLSDIRCKLTTGGLGQSRGKAIPTRLSQVLLVTETFILAYVITGINVELPNSAVLTFMLNVSHVELHGAFGVVLESLRSRVAILEEKIGILEKKSYLKSSVENPAGGEHAHVFIYLLFKNLHAFY